MRYFTIVQPKGETAEPEYVTLSEEDIRKEYYSYWYKKMCEKYEQSYVDEHYCFQDCLDDWKIIHWAQEVKE